MKVGIITYHNVINYGAVLQALALQESIKELGVDSEIINYTPIKIFSDYKPFSLFKYKKIYKMGFKIFLRAVASDIKHGLNITLKNKGFSDFGNKYFNYSGNSFNDFNKSHINLPDYDVCFTGSDQVWNPDITYGFDDAYFLRFGKETMIRASYAASIGKEKFSEKEEEQLREYLNDFNYISLRESTAADILSPLTDKNLNIVLDPTLLLNAEKWKNLLGIADNKEKYIFVYTLYPNPELNKFVEKLSKHKNLPVITLNGKKIYSNESARYLRANPQKFVELVANASYVVTNSFHGTAFSVNFSKNFYAFLGESRNSRITDLLTKLNIQQRAVKKCSDELLEESNIDYSSVQQILSCEREKSIGYIKNVLEGK
ncbi:MAG: polysaccharide pyruvyl transferase family protein [Clostridia bacterium]|nr:polysaccharide pyruvyl transferase family protein [Clostridia bacterium]